MRETNSKSLPRIINDMDESINKFFTSLGEIVDDLILLCDDDFIILWANTSAKNFFKGKELHKVKLFDLPVQLTSDDFESFVEKIYLLGKYSGELKCENESGLIEIRKIQAISLLNDIDQKRYFLVKISDENHENIKLELEKNKEELRNLAIYLQNAREEERAKIARELHDDIGQLLTILKMDFQSILMDESLTKEEITEKIKNSLLILDETISITRKLISELRLAILDHLGLVPALEHLVDEFKEKTKIDVYYEFEDDIKIEKEIAVHLFRVCQELLTNIRKHSKASKVEFILKKSNGNLTIQIKDNGIGFDKNELQERNSFGLIGIRERLYILNGEIELETSKGSGTRITITIPLKDETANS